MAGVAGPFREGAELFLSCQVSGGKFGGGSIDGAEFVLPSSSNFFYIGNSGERRNRRMRTNGPVIDGTGDFGRHL